MVALMGMTTVATAQTPPASTDGAVEALKPGEFLWAPDIAPDGPVTMIVGLKTQRAYLYRNGLPIGVSTISSGRPGYRTPTGIFTILQKDADHKSNLYKDAPMPFMQRLTWGGIALHAGDLPGYPDSHGCVRLPLAFAKLLFGVTRLGLTVIITDNAQAPEISPAPGIIAATPDDPRQPPQSYIWQPDRSPAGPISVVVSGRDRRVVVLRNGIEIGSAAITIDGPVETTEAFTLKSIDPAGIRWLRLPLPGKPKPIAPELTPIERARAHLPEAFRLLLDGILSPGTTLLVTRDSLRSSGTGTNIVVLAADGKGTATP
ncbi:hypothetical protein ACVWZA_003120 [Sphingomonas sp. UYAg733]